MSTIKRGKIIINPSQESGTTVYFDNITFLNPPSVNITTNQLALTYLEDITKDYFSFRINSDLNENITVHYVAIETASTGGDNIMSRDFLATRLRTERIIGTGSAPSKKLIVYSDTNATNNEGGITSGLQGRLDALGDDVFIYIDGIPDGVANNTPFSTAVFGGDVVVKGTLYADNLNAEDAISSLWEPVLDTTDELTMTGILDGDTGIFAIDLSTNTSDGPSGGFGFSINDYTLSSNNESFDLYFEYDENNDIMPKL